MALLEVQQLSCARGDRQLLSHVNFSISQGELLQVIGPNGVGKTTLLRIITGLLQTCEGQLLWRDKPMKRALREFRSDLFYSGHDHGVKQSLTVLENICLDPQFARLPVTQIVQSLRLMSLGDHLDHYARNLSQGQRQRVALTKLLLSKAALWVLDEPLASLDKWGVQKIQELFQEKVNQGGAIILTTHQPLTLKSLPIHTLELQPLEEGVA